MHPREHMRKHVVILGAGFAGLSAALELEQLRRVTGQEFNVTLVDKNCYHLYHALLYEVATAREKLSEKDLAMVESGVCIRLKSLNQLLLKKNIQVVQDPVTGIDFGARQVHLTIDPPLHYDYLIVALGSVVNDFGIPGLGQYSITLKELPDALAIYRRLQTLMTQTEASKKKMRVVIGGGGVSGVETAGELRHYVLRLAQQHHFDPDLITVDMVEAGPTILAGMAPWVQEAGIKRLAKLGVNVTTGQPIVGVDQDNIRLKNGKKMPYDLFIWSGGIKAHDLIPRLGIQCTGNKNQVCVTAELHLPNDDHVYVVGDAAFVMDEAAKHPVPQTAPVAISEGRVAAANVYRAISQQPLQPYIPQPVGYVFPVGGRWAISTMWGINLTGFWGWIARKIVDLEYFMDVLAFRQALKVFVQGGRIYLQND